MQASIPNCVNSQVIETSGRCKLFTVTDSDFKLESPSGGNDSFQPKEPLFSMLCGMPYQSLQFTLQQLNDYDSPAALDDIMPQTGLTRREMLQHVMYVINHIHRNG